MRPIHKEFVVNGSKYHVEKCTVDAGMRFGLKVAAALAGAVPALMAGQGDSMARFQAALSSANLDAAKFDALAAEARPQIILPNNMKAGDPVAFEAWFDDHPGDVLQVHALAVWKLVEDFMPPSLRTVAAATTSTAAKA